MALDDVVGRLALCHAHIRRFLAEAEELATGRGEPAQRQHSARAVGRYFRVGLPLHEADEDASIAPRLGTRDMERALRRMDEHAAIDDAFAILCEDWARWAEDPDAEIDLEAYRSLLSSVAVATESHLRLEEHQLFPAIRALPVAVRREIVREMLARRR
jgi:hypothetical protein